MLIGTTPSYSWTLPFDSSNIATLKITFKQEDNIVLVKRMSDCKLNGKQLSVTLTQEETFLFKDGAAVVQVRGLDKDGHAFGTVPKKIGIVECNDDEVLEPDEVLE